MRISWFIVIEAFLLSIVFANTEDPNRLEDLTTQESVSFANVNSSTEEDFATTNQQSQDPEKTRSVRHIPSISSPIFAESHWPLIESPIFFESSLQDKEKTKLVLIEPFFRAKKEEKGFWGWLKKIFGNKHDNMEKIGQGPLIGPVKVPGMGDNVYIRAADSENEADHVVIHLMMKSPPEKEIKFESHLPLVNFDTVHELPGESSSFQTIVSPQFSHEGLFDKSHFPAAVDASWPSVSSSTINFPSVKENFYANPSFFRKHSTENEGSEFPGALTKDAQEAQQFVVWPQQQYENYGEGDRGQNFHEAENNRQFSSAREDISNIQRTQTSGLEIAEKSNEKSLPLYPPLFNGSFGQNNLNNKNQVYVTNSNKKSSTGPKRESQPYPGLGAYKSEFKIVTLPKNVTIEEEYISNAGIQEVEAPNLSQAENRGIYQFSEIDNAEKIGDNSKIENSKRIRNSHSSVYGNYGITDSEDSKTNSDSGDTISISNETDEALKTISASYPWEYRASKDKFDIPKPEEDKVILPESSDSDAASISKSKNLTDDTSKKIVRNDSRFRNRIRTRYRGLEIKNKKPTNQTEKDPEFQENKSQNTLEDKKIEIVVEEKNGDKEEMEKPLTPEKVKEFFLKESKRFEEVLKTVEEESEAIEEEKRKVKEVKSKNYENDSHGDTKEELKIIPELKDDEEKSKEPQKSKIDKKEIKELDQLKNTKKEQKSIKEIPKDVKEEPKTTEENSKTIEENSKAVKKELDTLRKDLKAVKEELKISREKAKSKPAEEIPKSESKPNDQKPKIEESKFTTEIPNNHKEKIKSTRKSAKSIEEKSISTKKETIIDEVKLKPENIPLKKLLNSKEISSQEKLSSEMKTPENNPNLNQKLNVTISGSRITNKSRSRKPIKEMKKSNSTTRFELKKPKFPIIDGRFKSKLQNSTNFVKSNSTAKIESSTPVSHITRINAKNRFADKLKYKAKKEKIIESEENKKTDELKEISIKVEKPKIQISKFSPRIRNFKPKNSSKIASDEVKS